MEKPYDKSVDLWTLGKLYFKLYIMFIIYTIGIITYMILSASLPFDDPNSEKEIAR